VDQASALNRRCSRSQRGCRVVNDKLQISHGDVRQRLMDNSIPGGAMDGLNFVDGGR